MNKKQIQYSIEKARMSPRKTRTFNQWQSMQKAKSNGKREKKFFFPACQLERARVLGFLAKHLAAMKGNKGSKGINFTQLKSRVSQKWILGYISNFYTSGIRTTPRFERCHSHPLYRLPQNHSSEITLTSVCFG